ncbi:MAG TPA: fibronectin type III domain-containing protein [Spirochaetia bacterium]|nr:fibronectin type III domain-containing protein [Spirochaetia bacterium]
MKLFSLKKITAIISCFSLVLQSFLSFSLVLPAYAVDEVASDSGTVAETPVIASESAVIQLSEISPEIPTDTTPVVDDKTIVFENVSIGNTYTSKDGKATVTFTEITGPSGSLTIKEITLTPEQIIESGAVSETAYDITSSMTDGTFQYNLTLPKPETDEIEVKYSEDGQNFVTSGGVSTTENEVVISNINHFTIFVVTSGIDTTFWSHLLNTSDTNELKSSNNVYYQSDSNWPISWNTDFQKNQYIEFVLNTNIPVGAKITNASIIFEYQRDEFKSGSSRDSQIRVWNGINFDQIIADYDDLKIDDPNTDKTIIIPVSPELVPYGENIFKIRFYMRGRGPWYSPLIKTRHDYVALNISYTLPAPTNGQPNNLTTSNKNVNFTWNSVADSRLVRYELQMSKNPAEVDGVLSEGLISSGTLSTNSFPTTLTSDGKWYWQVRTINSDNQPGSWSEIWNVSLDTTSPVISIGNGNGNFNTGPIDNKRYSGLIDVYASLSDPNLKNYHFRIIKDGSADSHTCGNSLADSTNQGYGKCGYIYNQVTSQTSDLDNSIITPLLDTTQFGGDGTYWLILGAIDTLGNRGKPNYLDDPRIKIVVDNTAPSIPTGIFFKDTDNNRDVSCGSYTSTKHLDVYWSANTESDFDHYEYVSFNADGSTGQIRNFTTNYFNASWWTIPREGIYGVQIRAVDEAGNASLWSGGDKNIDNSCKFIVDWSGPSVPILTWPIDGIITNDNTPLMQWEDSTDIGGSGVAGYRYIVHYHCTNASDINTCTTVYPNLLGLWVTPSQLQAGHTNDGVYYWQVRAEDKVGNQSAWSEAEKVTIDTVAPIITIDPYNTSWTNQNINVTASVNEGTLNFSSYLFTSNDEFTFIATDAASNSSSKTVVISNIDKKVPVVNADNASSSWKNVNFDITLSVSDTGGSMLSVAKYNWDSAASETVGTDFQNGQTINPLQGSHVLYLYAKDNAGNESTWNGTYKFDSEKPLAPKLDAPEDGFKTKGVAFSQKWESVADAVLYEYQSCNYDAGSGNCTSVKYSANFTGTTKSVGAGQPNSHFWWRVRAKDIANNWSDWSESRELIIDNSAPTTSVSGIDSLWHNTPVTLTFTCLDTGNSGCDKTYYSINDGEMTEGNSLTLSIEGQYDISYYSTDLAGNIESEKNAGTVKIDTTDPESIITAPENPGSGSTIFTNEWTGSIAGTATDNLSQVSSVKISIQNSSGLYFNGESFVESESEYLLDTIYESGEWEYSGLTSPLEDSYTIKSHAIDNAGNQENTYTITVIFDKTIPEVSISINPIDPDADNGWYKTQPEITLTSTDTNFQKIEYQWNGKAEESWTEYTNPFKPASEGAQVLYYRAWDKAGNVSDTGIKNIRWDETELNLAPQNVTADPNPTSGTTSKIKWEEAKDNTGIDKYEIRWYLNGGTSSQDHTVTVGSNIREKEIDQLVEGRWTVSVKAFDTAGHSKETTIELNVDRTGPAAPTLTLTGTGIGTATLSWTSVSDAKDYIVWYGNVPGSRLFGARVGNTTSYTVRGLGAGNYYFIVKAVDEAQNQGAESNEVSTGNIIGAPGVAEGTPAEGFSPEVQGANTDTPSTVSEPTPSVLGESVENNNYWWLLLLLVLPLYFGLRHVFKKK